MSLLSQMETSRTSTQFQVALARGADAAAAWLARSIRACNGTGSSAYYSRWYNPLRGWAAPYPETSGYIIPTLFDYADDSGQAFFAELAIRLTDWILSLQSEDGAFPGGLAVEGRVAPKSIFNTGQIIFGLVAAGCRTSNSDYLQAARRASLWLARQVDDTAGVWRTYGYVEGYTPAYYTRVCWPMLETWVRTRDDEIRDKAVRVLDTILAWVRPNGAAENWGFRPGRPAFTHTIAYTMRGFLESGHILGERGQHYIDAAIRMAEALRRSLERHGRLAGAYDLDLKGRSWYTCLTGNSQLALNWMIIYERFGDARFLSAAMKALGYVVERQKMRSIDPNLRGAIAGSSPLWGRYLTLRYPNWAAKFYLDACLKAHAILGRLLEEGPCALQ